MQHGHSCSDCCCNSIPTRQSMADSPRGIYCVWEKRAPFFSVVLSLCMSCGSTVSPSPGALVDLCDVHGCVRNPGVVLSDGNVYLCTLSI